MAGKECSFNETVGRRTRDKGYKDAPVYFDNKLVLDAGGGVCQVSTTLFNAALRAGMIIGSRAPHYAPAGYVPVGMDATVADDSLDFPLRTLLTIPYISIQKWAMHRLPFIFWAIIKTHAR